ncbi:unnamed protein product (macronuclear) [Paramecium tetraurelia]|uniref:Protein kinase domain containing protein n=1 Tax=Paramecium tetraurelia TaxID=5888 RepID=A0CEY6_PARTE|nr:uncharacterized protein GSPATT00037792001 [Paramecium tetraurelia]CAK69353.1 unnamed protein product [Paramecium tetraurelia]|eukprot:XP_001436750.1 hypothetical protein (macronuclear) [Paramecium tetraurelia strain d4-2]
MGCCINSNKLNKIQTIKTNNGVIIFTSTADIHKIYNFGKMMGLGVFGKVLVAKMKTNNEKLFAIKMIEKSRVSGKETQLANEIYVLQRLDHPNIIKFNEVYQNNLYFYICMEYCEGGELLERIPKHQSAFTEKQAQQIAYKVLSAIAYIHEQGIVHRDIKPENILFTKKDLNSEPKIIDFGMAIKLDESLQTKTLNCVGTPLYVAPEVIDGYYSDKCDIWSFGVMLFYILCGYPPFYASNKKELFQHIQNQDLIFDRRHWNHMSREIKTFLRKLLCKNPMIRPTAKDCLKDPWFSLNFEEVNKKKDLRRSKTKVLTLKQIAPTDYFEDGRSIYEMLKNYRTGARLKKEVMKILINQMNEKELEHLKRLFQKIDEDNSGTITYHELEKALQSEGSQVSHDEVKKLMITIGMDNDDETLECSSGKSFKPLVIKYSDFLTACIDERRVLTKEKLLSLFKYFDHQNLNYITKENIQEVFARHGRSLTDEKLNQMIYEIDPNHDQKISFDEFCQMMSVEGVCQVIDFKDSNLEQQIISPKIDTKLELIQFE